VLRRHREITRKYHMGGQILEQIDHVQTMAVKAELVNRRQALQIAVTLILVFHLNNTQYQTVYIRYGITPFDLLREYLI
jgi:hypothetical protein